MQTGLFWSRYAKKPYRGSAEIRRLRSDTSSGEITVDIQVEFRLTSTLLLALKYFFAKGATNIITAPVVL